MSNHHGHHRSSSSHHSRSRGHHSSHYQSSHSRSRTSSSLLNNTSNSSNRGGGGGSGSGSQHQHSQSQQQQNHHDIKSTGSDWSEHQSSSGKVYYYNTKTGVSQWEIPNELKQPRQTSPESEISESSSIRHQQDKSPGSSASSNQSVNSDSAPEDKPLLTPSLAQYYKPELIASLRSSQVEELERQANQHAHDALMLSERILKESVELKISKAVVHYVEIQLEAQEKKYSILRDTINNYGFV